MGIKKLNVYSDPSHSWLKVKKQELIELGIADKISSCSYQYNDYAYLEEDCDVAYYINALNDKKGISWENVKIKMNHTNRRSKIRSYYNYTNQLTTKE